MLGVGEGVGLGVDVGDAVSDCPMPYLLCSLSCWACGGRRWCRVWGWAWRRR